MSPRPVLEFLAAAAATCSSLSAPAPAPHHITSGSQKFHAFPRLEHEHGRGPQGPRAPGTARHGNAKVSAPNGRPPSDCRSTYIWGPPRLLLFSSVQLSFFLPSIRPPLSVPFCYIHIFLFFFFSRSYWTWLASLAVGLSSFCLTDCSMLRAVQHELSPCTYTYSHI